MILKRSHMVLIVGSEPGLQGQECLRPRGSHLFSLRGTQSLLEGARADSQAIRIHSCTVVTARGDLVEDVVRLLRLGQ